MGIYEDWQIHTKTGFRPIKLQESRSGPHTNRTPSNKPGENIGGEPSSTSSVSFDEEILSKVFMTSYLDGIMKVEDTGHLPDSEF